MKKILIALFVLIIMSSCEKEQITHSSDLTKLEEKYTEQGPNSVSSTVIKNSNNKNMYKIFYPDQLSVKAPVISWGNGTGQDADVYTGIMKHLASWGFIVIDNYDTDTAPGGTILASAKYLIDENKNTSSIFYQKVDINNIGVAGHSQGAGAIINAHTEHSDGNLIKTIVPVAFPSLIKSYPEKVEVPIFFISGSNDGLISSVSSNQKAYNKIPQGVPAALGIRKTANHDAIIETNLETGYLTAWMLYQLTGDTEARKVFGGSDPELKSNPNWQDVSVKNIF